MYAVAMRRLGAGVPINIDKRNDLLRQIASGRETQGVIQKRVAGIPAGYASPFGDDQVAYEASLQTFQTSDPVVMGLETRLTQNPGPYWNDLTEKESGALALWVQSIAQMDRVTGKYFPTLTELDIQKFVLAAIGLAAIFAPLFFTEDEEKVASKFSFIPKPIIPKSMMRAAPSPAAQMPYRASLRPGGASGMAYRPAGAQSFSRVPLAPQQAAFTSIPGNAQWPQVSSPPGSSSQSLYPRFRRPQA